jgi:hypothetical protein
MPPWLARHPRSNILTERPDFEPIRDYHGINIQPPDSREVANYEGYLRRELPKFFKNALESTVSHEMQPIEERLSRQMLSVLEEAQKLAFSKYWSLIRPPAVDSPISASMQEGTHILTTEQSSHTSNNTHQPSIPPLLPNPASLLSFSDLEIPQAHELRHASCDMSNHSATLSEEQHTTLKRTASNTPLDSSSTSKSATELDDSLPLPDHELFESNPTPICSEGAVNLALFQDEWGLSSDNLDMSIFNWCPAGDLTPPEKRI